MSRRQKEQKEQKKRTLSKEGSPEKSSKKPKVGEEEKSSAEGEEEQKENEKYFNRIISKFDEFLKSEEKLAKQLGEKWKKKREKDAKVAYNPLGKKHKTLNTAAADFEEKSYSNPPIGFIISENKMDPGQGSSNPPAARVQIFEQDKSKGLIAESHEGEIRVICIPEGKLVEPEFLQADHLEAKIKFIEELGRLVETVNDNKKVADQIIKKSTYKDLLIKTTFKEGKEEKYYGTKLLYELAFNNIDNLWLICSKCNNKKSAKNPVEWLGDQPMLGGELLAFLQSEKITDNKNNIIQGKENEILTTVKNWYIQKSSEYIKNLKLIFEEITAPFESAARKIHEEKDLEEHSKKQTGFDIQASIAAAAAKEAFSDQVAKEVDQHPPEVTKQAQELIQERVGDTFEILVEEAYNSANEELQNKDQSPRSSPES